LHLAGSNGQSRHDFACCPLFHVFDDLADVGQIALNTANNLLIDVSEVIQGHPLFAQVLSQAIRVESKLQERVHFRRLLAHDQLSEVLRLQLVKAEEAQVGEDLVQRRIVTVGRRGVPLEEHLCEYLKPTC